MQHLAALSVRIFGAHPHRARTGESGLSSESRPSLPTFRPTWPAEFVRTLRESAANEAQKPERAPMSLLRREMTLVVTDCPPEIRAKMLRGIVRANNGTDLWMLRSEIFQVVAQTHGQAEARRRINELLPLFDQWVPARQLIAI